MSLVKCSLVNIEIANQRLLNRWRNSVSIMLEKLRGYIDIEKLRAIFLLEADYNELNKMVFNNRVMLSLKSNNSIPFKIIG